MKTVRQLLRSTEEFKPILFENAYGIDIESLKTSVSRGTKSILHVLVTRDQVHKQTKFPLNRKRDIPLGTTYAKASRKYRDHDKGPIAHGRSVQVQFVTDLEVPNLDSRILVRSSSPGYKYHFQYPNKKVQCHWGAISPFKVKGTGRPVNPKNYPGLDKHLIAVLRYMYKTGLLRSNLRF